MPALFFLILLSTAIASFAQVDDLIITTSYGKLRGFSTQSEDGQRIRIFKGVPFAQPPLGELRWKLAQKPTPWLDVLDATKYSAACMSNSTTSKSPQKVVSEDCLYLNIFAPDHCSTSNKCPVVVYYHGGGMNYDSAVYFNDSYLIRSFASKGVMLVIPAYRLGFTGLLDFGDNQKYVPDNLGVHDAIEALRFLKTEVAAFGGDFEKLAIYGHSYGATLAFVVAYSPLTMKEVSVKRLVLMSCSIYPTAREFVRHNTKTLVVMAGCRRVSTKATIECMRKKDGLELLAAQQAIEGPNKQQNSFEGIIWDSEVVPYKGLPDMLMTKQKFDLIIGTTLNELDFPDETYTGGAAGDLYFYRNNKELAEIYVKLVESGVIKQNHSDASLAVILGTFQVARALKRQSNNVYLYSFEQATHAYHTDDLYYIMGVHAFDMDENEQVISTFYSDLFVNFTKTGVPSPLWTQFDEDTTSYFSIEVNVTTGRWPEMRTDYQHDLVSYWDKTAAKLDKIISAANAAGGKLKLGKEKIFRDLELPEDDEVPPRNGTIVAFVVHPRFMSFSTLMMIMVFFSIGILLGRFWLSRNADIQETVVILGADGRPLRIDAEKIPLLAEQIF